MDYLRKIDEYTTDEEKIKKYEELLHAIQMCAVVTLDTERMSKLVANICNWSYSHRFGNGIFTDEQQQELVNQAFHRLTKID